MIALLTELFQIAPNVMAQFFLVFLRIGAAVFILPLFGESMVPTRIRLGVALAFSFVVFPSLDPFVGSEDDLERYYAFHGLAEILTGLVIGLVLRFHIMAIQVAASIAAQSTSLSQLLGNNTIDPHPALGLILYMAALALAASMGLHIQFVIMFVISFDAVPMGELLSVNVAGLMRDAASAAFQFGFVLAAPFVAASLLYNFALGVINRAMPQLMVAFVGAPAITLGALILLALTAQLILTVWSDRLVFHISDPFGAQR